MSVRRSTGRVRHSRYCTELHKLLGRHDKPGRLSNWVQIRTRSAFARGTTTSFDGSKRSWRACRRPTSTLEGDVTWVMLFDDFEKCLNCGGSLLIGTLAKLSRPRTGCIVQRERLFAWLDSLLVDASVWIFGPPGAGKTSLAASFLDGRGLGGIWYQADDGDIDLGSFFHYLSRAAEGVRGDIRLPVFTPEFLPELSAFARNFFRVLWAQLPRPSAFVLDNYQDVPADAALHSVIRDALAELPADISGIILSRASPCAAFARQRANRRLREIDWMELRLTIEEGQALAAAAHAPNPEQLSSLLARCDGWAAGLVLMLDGLRPGSARFAEPRQVTFDYFPSELFGRLPVETQAILLDTCLAPWVNAEMASALTGNARAPHLLEELWRKHLFVYL